MTLENETGVVNVIVRASVAEVQRQPRLGARLLTVYGQWQREGEGDCAVRQCAGPPGWSTARRCCRAC